MIGGGATPAPPHPFILQNCVYFYVGNLTKNVNNSKFSDVNNEVSVRNVTN